MSFRKHDYIRVEKEFGVNADGERRNTTNDRILVVDDEPTITEFLETGLTYEGYTVLTVADGAAALDAAHYLPSRDRDPGCDAAGY